MRYDDNEILDKELAEPPSEPPYEWTWKDTKEFIGSLLSIGLSIFALNSESESWLFFLSGLLFAVGFFFFVLSIFRIHQAFFRKK